MNAETLPTSKELCGRLRIFDSLVAIPAMAVISVYIAAAIEFRPVELQALILSMLIYSVPSAVIVEWLRARQLEPVTRLLDGVHGGAGDAELV